ncbi:uncharacterized protein LY89DRAFT_620563 [Mollisia scopiformis]|uniref:Autophagy-related protein 29 n=1 Tax=Mollisia scopiformis TaxID=149040 RepID=A0A194X200_MOLSC|nr:uncharacterized protein LY89DRAFT_620563 [Mollisia scopiformis]KUJ14221.1 hypothetical protein LY89DRAFT_620563 [Mollisia scopiformis]
MSGADPLYTVFIRLPFPRGDFVDPPSVEWDAAKDKALWKILSKASKNSDIDWNELASKFEVTLAFLLQQAAWLYERQLSQVRAQMRKVGVSKTSAAPSPIPGSAADSAGGESMRRTGSGGGGPRVTSALSARKDSPIPGSIPNTPGRSMAPPFSRTSSANTTVTSRNFAPQTSPRPAQATLNRRSLSPKPKSRPTSIAIDPPTRSPRPDPLSSPSVSSSDSSSDDSPPLQSRLLRRPPRFSNKLGQSEDADDDDDEPAFMPFSTPAEAGTTHHDPSATLRGDPRSMGRKVPVYRKSMDAALQSATSDSSASSTPATKRPGPLHGLHRQRPTGPLSPKRTAELAGRSPGMKGKGRDGSEGSPSMGSSFSDLDDASVTQSALEEALASNMQAGGMASRMSTISQALRSKYL